MTNTRTWSPDRPDLQLSERTREVLRDYRTHLRARGLSIGTVQCYVNHLANLAARHGDLFKIALEDLEDELARRRHTHAAESRKSMRTSWRGFYDWALRTGRTNTNPTQNLRPVRVPVSAGRIAADTDILAALQLATLREKVAILLGRLAGLRLSEMVGLKIQDREGNILRIWGKGDKERFVPIPHDLATILDRYQATLPPDTEYYFAGQFGGHMHAQSMNKIITNRAHVNPHSLRHAYATASFNGAHDLEALRANLGHASLATTQRYLHTSDEAKRLAAEGAALALGNLVQPSVFEG